MQDGIRNESQPSLRFLTCYMWEITDGLLVHLTCLGTPLFQWPSVYRVEEHADLSQDLLSNKSALKCVTNHWKQEPSRLNINRSNQCCEWVIKVVQELHTTCKNTVSQPLCFILWISLPSTWLLTNLTLYDLPYFYCSGMQNTILLTVTD